MEWETNDEILINLSKRLKKIRKIKKITQVELANRSNVSYGSIKRFEISGDISLRSLIRICNELGVTNEIKELFTSNYYKDIKEVIENEK